MKNFTYENDYLKLSVISDFSQWSWQENKIILDIKNQWKQEIEFFWEIELLEFMQWVENINKTIKSYREYEWKKLFYNVTATKC